MSRPAIAPGAVRWHGRGRQGGRDVNDGGQGADRGNRAGVVIAGGLSRRMGTDKAMVRLGGRPLVGHALDALAPLAAHLAINAPTGRPGLADLGVPVIADRLPDFAGPLAGLDAAFSFATALPERPELLLTLPVDTPRVGPAVLARLVARSAAGGRPAVAAAGGRVHPLVAAWPVPLGVHLAAHLERTGGGSVMAFLASIEHEIVDCDDLGAGRFANLNAPEDLPDHWDNPEI